MKLHGTIYYSGSNYDKNGHCDEYDLMFVRSDNGNELCLNGFEDVVFPDYRKAMEEGNSWISPISVHDIMEGTLEIAFTQEREIPSDIA